MIVALIISVLCVVIDQVTKCLLYGKSFSLIGNFLWIESGFNTGASFSIFSNATLFLIIFSIPVLVFMIFAIVSNKISKSKFFKIALGFIVGGTIGNLIDRIAFGGVRDFIYFKSINFAIFNFADVFINIGAYMLFGFVLYCIIKEFKQEKAKKAVSQSVGQDETIMTKDESKNGEEKNIEKNETVERSEDETENNSQSLNTTAKRRKKTNDEFHGMRISQKKDKK